MNTRLKHIQNWLQLAEQANWSIAESALHCGVSSRTLHRHFEKQTGKSTRMWICEQRPHYASELLKNGDSVKATAAKVGYNHAANFTRKFKSFYRISPSEQRHDAAKNAVATYVRK